MFLFKLKELKIFCGLVGYENKNFWRWKRKRFDIKMGTKK